MDSPEAALERLGLSLPEPFRPSSLFSTSRRAGSMLHVAGHGPVLDGRIAFVGKVGRDLDLEAGRASAELTMLNVLATVRAQVGELGKIEGFVHLAVFVNATEEFTEHHLVADGASRLLAALFIPTVAAHARFAIGVASLPLGMATEIGAQIEVR
jgi:enamine deaminase RidA (YjgF/YER057c/UK114 family)